MIKNSKEYTYSQDELDNRSRQLNDENDEYYRSRGLM